MLALFKWNLTTKYRYSLDEFDHNMWSGKDIYVRRFWVNTWFWSQREHCVSLMMSFQCPKQWKNPESYNISSLRLTFLITIFIKRMNFLKRRKNITAAEILIEGWNYVSCTAITSEIILLPKSRQSIANCNWDILLEANLLL